MTASLWRGRWCADFRILLPGHEKPVRVRKAAPTNSRRAAEAYERELREKLVAEAKAALVARAAPPTLKAFSPEFLQNWAATWNRPVELEQKKRVLKKHLLPALGELRLDEITPRVVTAYARMKLDDPKRPLHPTTVNQHVAILRKALNVAHEWGLIERAPRFRKLDTPEPDWDFLEPAESERLLEAAAKQDPEAHLMVLTALRTGLRITEILALRWEQVDTRAGTILVKRSRSTKKETGPKTKKTRPIDMSPQLVAAMKARRHLRGPYVFCDLKGAPLTRDVAHGWLWRACRLAGLRRASWRILRHTCASQLLMAGRSLKEVQEILGHADLKMTLRYAHLAPSAKREAAAALDALGRAPERARKGGET